MILFHSMIINLVQRQKWGLNFISLKFECNVWVMFCAAYAYGFITKFELIREKNLPWMCEREIEKMCTGEAGTREMVNERLKGRRRRE